MTCIVGIAEQGKVYIGGDSAATSGYVVTLRADPKVFRIGRFLVGFTTSFRMGQLIRYAFHPPEVPGGMDVFQYMVTMFIDNLRECLKAGGYARRDAEQESGGSFLVGYAGRLFAIDNDYQVAESTSPYAAVGSGAETALGALYATRGAPAWQRINTALEAASQHTVYVRGPFIIEEL